MLFVFKIIDFLMFKVVFLKEVIYILSGWFSIFLVKNY